MAYRFTPAFIVKKLAALYDPFVNIFGVGILFQKKVLGKIHLNNGDTVLDVGCGTGTFLVIAKKAYPKCQFVDLDPDESILVIEQE